MFRTHQSMVIQVRPPMEAARLVTTEAWTERKFIAPADPPLKPNHPNQRSVVPMTTCETEWGRYASLAVP